MRKLFLIPTALLLLVAVVLPASSASAAARSPAADRVTQLPQIGDRSGPRVESSFIDDHMGYTVTLKQFKSSPLTPAAGRKLVANDTVMQFDIRWRHGDRQLVGLLHAFRHGTQLHLSVHQKVYFKDHMDATSMAHPAMVPFDLEGTVDGVRKDARGFLIGTHVKVDFQARLVGDPLGTRMILSGSLTIRRIGV